MNVYALPSQMPPSVWHRLVRALVDHESWFGLAWRPDVGWSQRAAGVRDFLRPMRIDQQVTDRWPGTQLLGHTATVARYHTSPSILPLLLATDDPFAWLAPDLPEDLFFGTDEKVAFASVSHERDAWLLKRRYARLIAQDITLSRQQLDPRDSQLLWIAAST